MKYEWANGILNDLCSFAYGKNLPDKNRIQGNIPVYGSNGIIGYHNTSISGKNGIIIGRKGTIGKIHFSNKPFWAIDTTYYITEKLANCDTLFLYYLLHTLKLEQMKSGSTIPCLNRDLAMGIPLRYPKCLTAQRLIANIISSLDDKIKNNNEINEKLEKVAQALFKHWFIDFEFPNENGNPYISSGGKIVESELGMIPEKWRMGKLSDIAHITMGQSLDYKSYNESGIGMAFYQEQAEFGWRFPTRRLFTAEPKKMAHANDVLISTRTPTGNINVAADNCCIGRGLASIHSIYHNQSYLLYLLKSMNQRFDAFNSEGSVFDSINRNDLNNLVIILPDTEILQQFESIVSDIDLVIKNNVYKTINLTHIREILLPKLMSGDIL